MIMNSLRRVMLLVISVAFSAHVSAQSLVQLSGHTAFETFRTLEIDQLWNSTSPEITQGTNSVVVARRFDVEARPRLDKWIGCGWLLIGTGDVGAQPVGLKIWADASCRSMSIKKLESKIKGTELFDLNLGSNESFKLSVGSDLRVFLGEHEIGAIK